MVPLKLQDVTIDRVRKAYEKHNHKPDKDYGWNRISPTYGYRYYCPLQVLAVDLLDNVERWSEILGGANTILFYRGFDGESSPLLSSGVSYEKAPAVALGRLMRRIFVLGEEVESNAQAE